MKPKRKKHVTLDEIFSAIPQPTRRKIVLLLKEHYPNSSGEISRLLKPELNSVADELKEIGLVPDFAAYLIPYSVYIAAGSADHIDLLDSATDLP